ncbi:MFS transporter [Bryobacterales bacterium F-183]|nr:MFS transporter [Bryobacterales bacterium F-183]
MFGRTFAISWLAYASYYLCRKNFSVLMPYLKSEAGLTSNDLAAALFGYSVLYALGQFLMGNLVDRLGARWVAAFGMLASAALSFSMTLPLATTAVILIGIQALNGLAQSSGWPSVLKLAKQWFPETNRGVSMSWWSTHLVFGGLAGTWLATRSAEAHWTLAATIPAAVLTTVALLYLAVARDRPGQDDPDASVLPREKVRLQLSTPLVAIAAMYFCVKMARYAFLFWLPLYMTEYLRYEKPLAGYASSAFEFVGVLGALTAGIVSERLNRARFSVASVMMAVLAVLCFFYPAASSLGLVSNLIWIGLIGFFTFGPDTLMAGPALHDLVPTEAMGSAGGFVNGVGSIGQVLSPFVVAQVSQHAGWETLFAGLAGVVLCGSAVLMTPFLLKKRKEVIV